MGGRCARVVAAVLVLALAPTAVRAAPRTLAFRTLGGDYRVTFDTERLDEAAMRRLVLLSPHLHGWDSYTVVPRLELCLADDPVYLECGPPGPEGANFLRNARVNLAKGARALATLEGLVYPRELEPLVRYSRRALAFSLWLEETKLEYYRSWDPKALQRAYEDIDPAVTCAAVLAEIGRAREPEERYQVVAYRWHNCVNDLYRSRLGAYPVDAWEAFVRAHGVEEHLLESIDSR